MEWMLVREHGKARDDLAKLLAACFLGESGRRRSAFLVPEASRRTGRAVVDIEDTDLTLRV